jgi:hypothetical protein
MAVGVSGEITSKEKNWFHIEVNNYMSPSYSLTLMEDKVLFQEFYGDHDVPMQWCTASFSVSGYKFLSNDLKELGITDWNNYYVNKDFTDGTSYKLVINIDDLTLQINGANDYPKNFGKLLSVVNKLIEDSGCESSL